MTGSSAAGEAPQSPIAVIVEELTIEANKALVQEFYEQVINGRDCDAIDRMLSTDFRHNGEHRGRNGQRQAVEAFLRGFSDLHNEINLMLGERDLVAAHQTWSGTHDGEFLGNPPSGHEVVFTSTAILRVADGQIAEAWDVVDVALLGQLSG